MSRSLPGESTASAAQGIHLHPTVDPAPGALQSGEPALQYALHQRALDLGWEAGGH